MQKIDLTFFRFLMLNTFKKISLPRILQYYEMKNSNYNIEGKVLEIGSNPASKNAFISLVKGNISKYYADKFENNNLIFLDLEATNKINEKFKMVLAFNVLEHIFDTDNAIKEIKNILDTEGIFVGATPFLYRVHYAPEDYNRLTKQFYQKIFSKHNMQNINIKELGFGPLCVCYTIVFDYIKYIPFLSNFVLIMSILIDKLLNKFVKTPLNQIYPLTYFFYCKK